MAVLVSLGNRGSLVWAEEPSSGQAMGEPSESWGQIASVDAASKMLTLKEPPEVPGQPTNFVLNEKTSITREDKPIPLADLRSGDEVTVEYTQQGTKNVAQSVIVEESDTDDSPKASLEY